MPLFNNVSTCLIFNKVYTYLNQSLDSASNLKRPTTPDAPQTEPNALAESVTVKAGVVAVRRWMAEGKGKGQTP